MIGSKDGYATAFIVEMCLSGITFNIACKLLYLTTSPCQVKYQRLGNYRVWIKI